MKTKYILGSFFIAMFLLFFTTSIKHSFIEYKPKELEAQDAKPIAKAVHVQPVARAIPAKTISHQDDFHIAARGYNYQKVVEIPIRVVGETLSPNLEHYRAIHFLKYQVPPHERDYIVFFTTYDIPKELQDIGVRLLNAAVMSQSAGDKPAHIRRVPGTDTLYWADIRDYNWTREAWEKVSFQEPYIREPWINDEDAEDLRRLAGNSLVSASWFINNILDTSLQVDNHLEPLYYELLYSKLGGPPQSIEQFRNVWGVNQDRVDFFGQAKGAIIAKGDSGVARNERQIGGTGTDLGYYYETNDNKNGTQRYIDNLDPSLSRKDRDATEAIASNGVNWQVYFLGAKNKEGKEVRVEVADTTVAVDTSGRTDDVRVRMIKSCISCHVNGLNTANNQVEELVRQNIELYFSNRDNEHKIKSFYLSGFNERLLFHRQLYVAAVKRDTGWSGEDFVKNLEIFTKWYNTPLDIEQAARECGVNVEAFKQHTKDSPNATLTGLQRGIRVARDAWIIGDKSVFVEAMLLIHRSYLLDVEVDEKDIKKIKPEDLGFKFDPKQNLQTYNINGNICTVYKAVGNINVYRGKSIESIYQFGTLYNGQTVYVYDNKTSKSLFGIYYGTPGDYSWGYVKKTDVKPH